jgi:hypothetical protein
MTPPELELFSDLHLTANYTFIPNKSQERPRYSL